MQDFRITSKELSTKNIRKFSCPLISRSIMLSIMSRENAERARIIKLRNLQVVTDIISRNNGDQVTRISARRRYTGAEIRKRRSGRLSITLYWQPVSYVKPNNYVFRLAWSGRGNNANTPKQFTCTRASVRCAIYKCITTELLATND